MAREWTQAQKAAIDARNADVLVAAAAGSGKTAVLVERIIKRISDDQQPVDIDRLLVVTFTNAAASEMRQRIGEALTKRLEEEPNNELLSRQLSLLPKASITTIHSYCLRVLKANFNALGLDPNFRLADPTENDLIRFAALEEVVESMYEDEVFAEDFLKLTEAYLNIRNTTPFYELINQIYDFAMSLPHPTAWLTESAERLSCPENMNEHPYAVAMVDIGKGYIMSVLEKYDTMLKLSQSDDLCLDLFPFLLAEKRQIEHVNLSENYDDFYAHAKSVVFEKAPAAAKGAKSDCRKEILSIRDNLKKEWNKKLFEDLFQTDSEAQRKVLFSLQPLMVCLSEVVRRLMVCFDAKKEEKNLLNYNDLEHKCFELFVDENGDVTPVALSERERFDEILIDEYQDTSPLQEAIFNAIKKERSLFLVGDVKQSIYRFRNTNPQLFRDKKESYSESEAATQRKIILSNNFRSRASVLDAINFVFERVMSKTVGEITYDEEEKLYPGARYPDMEKPLSEETELWLTELSGQDEEEALESAEAEAILAAKRIVELIEGEYQVLGKDGVRTISYRDISVLMRTNKTAPIFCKTLSAYGIPCYSEAGDSFLESHEIEVMMSLLKIIDNPHQDIPLLTVLRSQLYALTTDELAEIRLADRQSDYFEALVKRAEQGDAFGERLQGFLKDLNSYRDQSRVLDVAELIWHLYMQTGFYEGQSTLEGATMRRLNLRLLHTRASAFEKTGLKGLYNFINFIDQFKGIGGDFDAARSIGEEQNVVRVMSIHKSKGLEFPVVILSGLGHKINMQDTAKNVLIHSDWGYGPKYVDTDLGLSYGNVARTVVKNAMTYEALSEELRILYVAMTRAREKLIMLASGKNLAGIAKKYISSASQHPVSPVLSGQAQRDVDWLLMAIMSHRDGEPLRELTETEMDGFPPSYGRFRVEVVDADSLFPETEEIERQEESAKETADVLPSLLWYQYAYREGVVLPAKLTVTELKRKHMEQEPDAVPLYPRPKFLMTEDGKLTRGEIGTAMHTVLERLKYEQCSCIDEIKEQVNDLVRQRILSAQEAEAVNCHQIFAFMESAIGKRLKEADCVKREQSFAVMTEAEPIFGIAGRIMLQGTIDCLIFEGEDISIVDYKTDRKGSPEEIAKLYAVQLESYARAVEIIYGKKVKQKYLYLFHFGQIIEL
ncbi:MAG: helicase-exonuclease AddAB subunit AddA [Ruminococcaceae bacterium]|nr:helicase-exonuclease AddAB subunit AddA [Oscillospiraceae bacterium]